MRIGLGQLLSTTDPARNLDLVADLVSQAADAGARVLVLPEATMARFGVPLQPIAEPLDGHWASAVRTLAGDAGLLVVAGMFTPADDGRVRNTLLITGAGVDTHYDKIHLFDAFGFAESDTVAPGTQPVSCSIDGVSLGVATCYDVRFPALFTRLAGDGAQVILVPSSWGAGEGKREQWELLVRARALDSTSWVVAVGQADPESVGVAPSRKAPNGIGYSTVASPDGRIHAQLGPKPELSVVEIDVSEVAVARKRLPVLNNARAFGAERRKAAPARG